MPTPFDLLRVADLIKLAADTAKECSEFEANGEMAQVAEVCMRIKADAEELEAIGKDMERKASRSDN